MKPTDDPTQDLYNLMDEAKLSGGHLLDSKRSMTSIVSEVRRELAMKLKSYIKRRDQQMHNEGFAKGRDSNNKQGETDAN